MMFHRTENMARETAYAAEGASHVYFIYRDGKDWTLKISQVNVVLGMHLTGAQVAIATLDRKADAVAVAKAFEALGDDYRQSEHRGRTRWSLALQNGLC